MAGRLRSRWCCALREARHAGDGFVVARASCLNIYRAVAVSGARRSGIARRFVLGQRLAGDQGFVDAREP